MDTTTYVIRALIALTIVCVVAGCASPMQKAGTRVASAEAQKAPTQRRECSACKEIRAVLENHFVKVRLTNEKLEPIALRRSVDVDTVRELYNANVKRKNGPWKDYFYVGDRYEVNVAVDNTKNSELMAGSIFSKSTVFSVKIEPSRVERLSALALTRLQARYNEVATAPTFMARVEALDDSMFASLDRETRKGIVREWSQSDNLPAPKTVNAKQRLRRLIQKNNYASAGAFDFWVRHLVTDIRSANAAYAMAQDCSSCDTNTLDAQVTEQMSQRSLDDLLNFVRVYGPEVAATAFRELVNEYVTLENAKAIARTYQANEGKLAKADRDADKLYDELKGKAVSLLSSEHSSWRDLTSLIRSYRSLNEVFSLDVADTVKRAIQEIRDPEATSVLMEVARRDDEFSAAAFTAYVDNIAKDVSDVYRQRNVWSRCASCRDELLSDIAAMDGFGDGWTKSDFRNFRTTKEYVLVYRYVPLTIRHHKPSSMPVGGSGTGAVEIKSSEIQNASLEVPVTYNCVVGNTRIVTNKEGFDQGLFEGLDSALSALFGDPRERYQIREYQKGEVRCVSDEAVDLVARVTDAIEGDASRPVSGTNENDMVDNDAVFTRTEKRLVGYKKLVWECDNGRKVDMQRVGDNKFNLEGRRISVPPRGEGRHSVMNSAFQDAVQAEC